MWGEAYSRQSEQPAERLRKGRMLDGFGQKKYQCGWTTPLMKWGVGGEEAESTERGRPSRACGPVKDLTFTLSFRNAVA